MLPSTSDSQEFWEDYDTVDLDVLPLPEEMIRSCSRSNSYTAITASFSESLRESAPVTITFQDVTVWAGPIRPYGKLFRPPENNNLNDRIMLLDHVTGYAKSGEVLAIMGSSGSGKSTLLNAIMGANLTENLEVSGAIRANGCPQVGAKISRISGYLQQDDLLFPSLTVKEYLRFQAALSLGDVLDETEQEEKVSDMLVTMGLLTCQDSRIGGAGHGKSISGGEMKRLAFGAALLTDPPVLFCDEPTTGLDSFRAEQLVAILRQLAALGKTIICVIHQPSSTVFDMFNRVIFLANGKIAFQGPTSSVTEFFQSAGHVCPDSFNPADYILNVLAMTEPDLQESEERISAICSSYESSSLQATVFKEITEGILSQASKRQISRLTQKTEKGPMYRVSFFTQLYWLLWRALLDLMRDPRILQTRLVQKIILGVVYGLIFHGTVLLTQEGIQNANGAMLCLVIESSFRILLNIVLINCSQMQIFYRESSSGYLYRSSAYYLASLISWLPVFFLDTTIFMVIGYFLMGLSTDAYKFGMTLATGLLIANTAAAVGNFISYITPSVNVAISFAQQTQYLVMIFSGALYITLTSFPKYLAWLQYFSWMRYGYEAISIVHWSDIRNITCTTNFTDTCITDGLSVLAREDYVVDRLNFDLYMLAVLIIGFNFAAFLALLFRVRFRK